MSEKDKEVYIDTVPLDQSRSYPYYIMCDCTPIKYGETWGKPEGQTVELKWNGSCWYGVCSSCETEYIDSLRMRSLANDTEPQQPDSPSQ